jgi:Icc protein
LLTFLHISDTHISADPAYHPPAIPDSLPHPNHGVERLLEAIDGLPFEIEFILHTGDVCADPHEKDYHCARELLSQLSQPLYLLPGNHDSAQLMEDILHDGEQLRVLRDAHVQLEGCHLLTLDSNGEGDIHAPNLRDEQIEWFAEQLESISDQPIIVGLHHALIETGVPWIDEQMRVQNGGRIQRLLQQHQHSITGVFYGHIHQMTTSVSGGVMYICCPSTWSNLAAYPGLKESEPDLNTAVGFNLVMLRDNHTFVRRYSLPLLGP